MSTETNTTPVASATPTATSTPAATTPAKTTVSSIRLEHQDTKAVVTFSPWDSKAGQAPRNALAETAVKIPTYINGTKTTVFSNASKSGVAYYYVEIAGIWYWSRNQVTEGKFKTYVKPEPAPKVKKEKVVKEKPVKATKPATTPAKTPAKTPVTPAVAADDVVEQTIEIIED